MKVKTTFAATQQVIETQSYEDISGKNEAKCSFVYLSFFGRADELCQSSI